LITESEKEIEKKNTTTPTKIPLEVFVREELKEEKEKFMIDTST